MDIDNNPLSHDELFTLLGFAANALLDSPDLKRFLDRMAEVGPILAPGMAVAIDPMTGPSALFFRALGVNIYGNTPLPQHNYKLRPLPKPGRNDPCYCGSGGKYKQCCAGLEGLDMCSDYNMLRHVLDCAPVKSFAALPTTQVDPEAVADTAWQWQQENELRRAIALLEPWFKPDVKLKARHGILFDTLMDLYLAAGHPNKRKKLLARVLQSDDKRLRADAFERQATMLMDSGDVQGAWDSFKQAQRLDPGAPSLALLEITMLTASGDPAQAQERARFWLAHFRRAGNVDPEFLTLLDDCAEDPVGTLSASMMSGDPHLDELLTLLQAAPGLQVHYRLEVFDNEGMLSPDQQLAALEQRWQAVFPSVKPSLTYTQHADDQVWDNARQWLALLAREPLLWNSLDVLDDLVMAVDALGISGWDTSLLAPLLARAEALMDGVIEGAAGELRLPWGFLENRPALRLLAHQAFDLLYGGGGDNTTLEFIRAAERLLCLNPNDNHGFRDSLSSAYIASGQPEATVALAQRYPDDGSCGLAMNHVLALYLCNQKGKALTRLADIRHRQAEAIKVLVASNPRQPKLKEGVITLGGKDEAWLYRESCLSLWQRQGALDWLREAWGSVR